MTGCRGRVLVTALVMGTDRQIRGVKGMVSDYLDIRSLPHFPPDHSLVFFIFCFQLLFMHRLIVISILSPYFPFCFWVYMTRKRAKLWLKNNLRRMLSPVKHAVNQVNTLIKADTLVLLTCKNSPVFVAIHVDTENCFYCRF